MLFAHLIIPKSGIMQNKSSIRGMFFKHKNRPRTHQLSPAFHHEFTIKKPRSAARFSQNPCKNSKVSPL
jgi:hypothetical protein